MIEGRGLARVLLTVALALLAPGLGGATPVLFDWDAGLGSRGDFSDHGDGPVFDSRDSLSLAAGVSHGMGPGEMTYSVAGQLAYMPQDLAAGDPRTNEVLAYPSAVSVAWEMQPPGLRDPWMHAALGRMDAREPTGLLLEDPLAVHPAQLLDGALVEVRYLGFYFSAQAGYLGLLDKRVNRVRFTDADARELSDGPHYFAPPRGLAILRTEADHLLAGQSLGLFGIWQKDFRAETPRLDTWYAGLVVNGQILSWLRQATDVVVGISVPSAGSTGAGLLVSSLVAMKLPGDLLHEAWLSGLWASGRGGGLSEFPALAGPAVSPAFDVPLQDIVKVELGADARLPVAPAGARLSPALTVCLLLVPSGTPAANYSFSLSGPFAGTEIALTLAYLPLDGFTVTARGAALITVSAVLPSVQLDTGVRL
ncbi:MAG TPA: hypothetical protein VFI08_07330 [Spirochaetia bacterium]|nr:hypothetical protein [Spirochaetia bacterium]